MAKLQSGIGAGLILISLWALEIAVAAKLTGYSPSNGVYMSLGVIIGLLLIMVTTLVGFIVWNNRND